MVSQRNVSRSIDRRDHTLSTELPVSAGESQGPKPASETHSQISRRTRSKVYYVPISTTEMQT
jgi:hypothetical protein